MTLVCAAGAGCDSAGPPPDAGAPRLPAFTTSPAQPTPTTADATPEDADYSHLLLRPEDLSDAEEPSRCGPRPRPVRLEFESAPGDATTDEFVVNIGNMQQIALRAGLSPSQ